MSRIFTLEYEHTWPMDCWPEAPGVLIWGQDAGKPTGQRFLVDVADVLNQEHALAIARSDASRGFGTILHAVTPQSDGYVSQGFRRKVPT